MSSLGRGNFVDPEDWRILRTLAAYRLLLIALLLAIHFLNLGTWFFERSEPKGFFNVVVAYAAPALLLMVGTYRRVPSIGLQAHLAFFVDTVAIVALMYTARGVSSGLGVLLITPAVGCSLVLPLRLGLLHAALATFAVFGAEFLRQSLNRIDSSDLTNAGLIGLMLFVTSLGAGAVAQRARKSEALAARFGSDLASLSRINERIIESMDTAVLVIDEERRLRLQNADLLTEYNLFECDLARPKVKAADFHGKAAHHRFERGLAGQRIDAAGIGHHFHALPPDLRQQRRHHMLDEIVGVTLVGVLHPLGGEDRHGDLGQIVEHQIGDFAGLDQLARTLGGVAPEAGTAADPDGSLHA